MSVQIVLQQMIVIVALVCLGMGMYRKKYIDDKMTEKLSAIVVDVCNPLLCLSCGLEAGVSASHHDIAMGFVMAIFVYAFLLVCGFVVPKLCGIPQGNQKFYNMMLVYGNIGFIGIPVAKAVLPPEAMIYVIILNILFSVVFYTHGVLVMGSKDDFHFKISPGIVCSLLTILIFWFDISLPGILSQTILYIGNATTFLSMALLGCSFAVASVKTLLSDWRMYLFAGIKMLVLPMGLGYLLKVFGMDETMIQAFVLLIAMPVANMPLMLAKQVGEETKVLTQGIMLTTLMTPVSLTLVSLVVNTTL